MTSNSLGAKDCFSTSPTQNETLVGFVCAASRATHILLPIDSRPHHARRRTRDLRPAEWADQIHRHRAPCGVNEAAFDGVFWLQPPPKAVKVSWRTTAGGIAPPTVWLAWIRSRSRLAHKVHFRPQASAIAWAAILVVILLRICRLSLTLTSCIRFRILQDAACGTTMCVLEGPHSLVLAALTLIRHPSVCDRARERQRKLHAILILQPCGLWYAWALAAHV